MPHMRNRWEKYMSIRFDYELQAQQLKRKLNN